VTPRRGAKSETHLVEWKQSWRDDYLRWLCGFANADGGTLIIGKNDQGDPVGAPDAERLLVDLSALDLPAQETRTPLG
jgi:ATP-dependent DNA helicase RecG